MAAIELTNVTKSWGKTVAVGDISFTVNSGTFVVLLGPSGCGKSTTLRMIAGLEEMTSGKVIIDGRDMSREPPSARRVSMVFQSYALFPHLDTRQNILFGLKVRRIERAERERRLIQVAEMVGLDQLLDRKPSQLSGGQRQRVALARAIVAENSICLMDEPLSNLDAKLRHEMRVEIRALQERLGMTVVYVTHDQTEAMSMADKVILMREGRIEQTGTPGQSLRRPVDEVLRRIHRHTAHEHPEAGRCGGRRRYCRERRTCRRRRFRPGPGIGHSPGTYRGRSDRGCPGHRHLLRLSGSRYDRVSANRRTRGVGADSRTVRPSFRRDDRTDLVGSRYPHLQLQEWTP